LWSVYGLNGVALRMPGGVRLARGLHLRRRAARARRAARQERIRRVPARAARRVNGLAVVPDRDGTLWPVDLVVRPGVRSAVAALVDAGVPVLVATARRVRGAHDLLRENGLWLPVVGLK